MTLIKLESGRSILIDMNIRQSGDGIRDVSADLRRRLDTDETGRPYVDAVLLTHPDQDHCRGLIEHFHLGPLADYKQPKSGELAKIVIREMWSSPIVFRRTPKDQTLCKDADAWRKEARRRVNLYKANRKFAAGDRIQVMGEDRDGKTDDIAEIVVKAGKTITSIDGNTDTAFRGRLLAPKGQGTDEEEERRSKNHSSVIVRFSVANGEKLHACRFLSGGDAMVGIWERIWADHSADTNTINYHLMQAPHHCSWHSLSYDSWGDLGEKAKVSPDARKALGQALSGAYIVATSKPIKNDKDDPPCIRAKREYEAILSSVNGVFLNTSLHGGEDDPVPMEFDVNATGPKLRAVVKQAATSARSLLRTSTAATIPPAGIGFPPRPVTPVKPAGFA
ncbi:ComEC/Rec2 family competence protein [Acetobacter conturbans]|nr:metallohydrolase [Acetobacter conturbans]